MERCNVRPEYLDDKMKAFENSDYSDLNILAEIIGLMKSGKDVSKKKEDTLVQNIKSYILQHLTDNITVEEIASNLNISYYYMCHIICIRIISCLFPEVGDAEYYGLQET